MSIEPWICPSCTLRQPRSLLCIFCGAPSPEATTDENPYYATLDTGESVNSDAIKIRRQYITQRVRAEFPHLHGEGFDADEIRNARKRVRFLVFGEPSQPALNTYEKSILLQDCLDDLFGYGALGALVRDPSIQEIRVFTKDLTTARKRGEDFRDAHIHFDDSNHLDRLVDIVKERSTPRSWQYKDGAEKDHYVTWDGIRIAVTHHPVPSGEPYMTMIFQEPIAYARDDSDVTESSVRPLENHTLISQRRQFICNHLKKEIPHFNQESFEKIRKKLRQLVFGDSSGSRLTPYEKTVLYQDCLDEMFGFGPLGPLLRDPEIVEIRIYSPEKTTVKRRGLFETMSVMFDDESHLRRMVNLIIAQSQPRGSDDERREEYITPTGSRISVAKSRAQQDDDPYLIINHDGR